METLIPTRRNEAIKTSSTLPFNFEFSFERYSNTEGFVGPWVLLGGKSPASTLKYFTFLNFFKTHLPISQKVKGIIEITSGSTALALNKIAQDLGLAIKIITPSDGAVYLREHGVRADFEICNELGPSFELAQALSSDGWLWPNQFSNQALVGSVSSWAREVMSQASKRMQPKKVLLGVGTGATYLGFKRVCAPLGIEVIGFQNSAQSGYRGMRHLPTQNLGPSDILDAALYGSQFVELPNKKNKNSAALEMIEYAVQNKFNPSETLVITHISQIAEI